MSVLAPMGLSSGQGMRCLTSFLHELVIEAVGISVLNLAAGLGWAPSTRGFYLATQWFWASVWTLPFQERAGTGAHEGSWGVGPGEWRGKEDSTGMTLFSPAPLEV